MRYFLIHPFLENSQLVINHGDRKGARGLLKRIAMPTLRKYIVTFLRLQYGQQHTPLSVLIRVRSAKNVMLKKQSNTYLIIYDVRNVTVKKNT